jgi:hypothetical protein
VLVPAGIVTVPFVAARDADYQVVREYIRIRK